MTMRTVSLAALLLAGASAAATFPGPCGPTLQACIDAAAPGDTIAIATDAAIDEDLTIAKTLTLAPAGGFSPVIGTGALHRTLAVTDAGAGAGSVDVTVAGLSLANAEIAISLAHESGHRVVVRDCDVAHGSGSLNGTGIGVNVSVPAAVTIEHNTVATPGSDVHVTSALTAGSATITVLANDLTTFNPAGSLNGVLVDIEGAGALTLYVYSNVIHGVSGASGGAGIDVRSVNAGGAAAVNIVNNTLDDIQNASNGIQIRPPNAAAQIAVNLFNNVVTHATKSGIAVLESPAVPELAVTAGYNDSFMNAQADAFGGYSAGPGTLTVDPNYVGGGNYHLRAGSPLIDAGTANSPGGLPAIDADRNLRVAGGGPDIGAFEYGSTPASTTTTATTSTTTTTLPGSACGAATTVEGVLCHLDALGGQVDAGIPAGRLADRLAATLGRARLATENAAAAMEAGRTRRARSQLRSASSALARFLHLVRSQVQPSDTRAMLIAEARTVRAGLRTLLRR